MIDPQKGQEGISIDASHHYAAAGGAAFVILGAITFCHLLNDVMQALLPAIYPMLKSGFALSFGQIGLLDADLSGHSFSSAANGRALH